MFFLCVYTNKKKVIKYLSAIIANYRTFYFITEAVTEIFSLLSFFHISFTNYKFYSGRELS